jgi:hypothetical protein
MARMSNCRKPCYFHPVFAAALPAVIMMLLPDPDQMVRTTHLAISTTAEASENRPMVPQKTTPPARDPEIAVAEEYQIAKQRGTREALELFIARHPDSPLAEKARADLPRISR